jgi:hypothetical protein
MQLAILGGTLPNIISQCSMVLEAMYLKGNINIVQNGVTEQKVRCIDILISSSHAANYKQAVSGTHEVTRKVMILISWSCFLSLMQMELPGTHIIYIRVTYLQSFAVSEYMLWAASPCFKPSKLGGSKSDATCKNFKAESK